MISDEVSIMHVDSGRVSLRRLCFRTPFMTGHWKLPLSIQLSQGNLRTRMVIDMSQDLPNMGHRVEGFDDMSTAKERAVSSALQAVDC